MKNYSELRAGFETAYIDGSVSCIQATICF